MDILERFNGYDETCCWQYKIRQNNQASDLIESNLTQELVDNLHIKDFTFHFIPKDDKENFKLIKSFIEKIFFHSFFHSFIVFIINEIKWVNYG